MASQKGLGLNPKAKKLRYLDRTAEEAGRQKGSGKIPNRLTPKKVVAKNIDVQDLEDVGLDFGVYYPSKFIKSNSERAQLDKLGAIYGLLKGYLNKTFDEYYSAFKTGCSQNSVSSMHVAQHAMEKLHTRVEIRDGIIYGSNNRGFGQILLRLKKDDYYVDFDGIIRRIDTDNLPKPKVYPKRKGFWAEVKVEVKIDGVTKKIPKLKYIIGPFCCKEIKKPELQAFVLEPQFCNNIIWKPGNKRLISEVPEGCFQVNDWAQSYWSPKYYLVLEEAKLQKNPYSMNKNCKESYSSIGKVIYEEDFYVYS